MANYPFKINIQTKNGTQLSYYSSSFATSADTNVSASSIVDSINALPRVQYTQSEAVPNDGGFLSDYSTAGATGGKTYLSASHNGPQSGSITFTDTEDSSANGGLDFYTFWGTKVCSVLGIPEGIPIYTENFKFSDDETDTTNYISGDVIADGITVKEGFKLSTQARVRGNLIFDDVFGEGFVQFVSGSVTKMTVGYNDDKDFYKIGGSTNVQISGSSANIGVLSGVTTINSSDSPATNIFSSNFINGRDRIAKETYNFDISANGAYDATDYTRGQIRLSTQFGTVNDRDQNVIIGNNHIRYSANEVWSGAVDTGLTHEDFPLYIHNATTAAVNTFAGIAFNIGGNFSSTGDGPRMMGGISIHRLSATEANRTANMIFSLNSGTTAGSGGSDADHGLSTRMTLSHDGNLDVSNNITLGGTVDGVDVATIGGYLNQAVKTTSTPTFADITITDLGTFAGGINVGATTDPGTDNMIVAGTSVFGKDTSTNDFTMQVYNGNNDGIVLIRDDSSSTDNEHMGAIAWDSLDGGTTTSTLQASAYILGTLAENHSSTNKGGDIRIGTKAKGIAHGGNATERMRITSEGDIGIGTNGDPSYRLEVNDSVTGGNNPVVQIHNTSGTDTSIREHLEIRSGDNTINSDTRWITFRNNSGNFAGLISNDPVSYGSFTGFHMSQNNLTDAQITGSWIPGMIVKSNGNIIGSGSYLSEALPEVEPTTTQKDKAVMGVYTHVSPPDQWRDMDDSKGAIFYNSIGEGRVLVTDTNGNIENGDYICSSNREGHGEKQDDDLLHNYTVAKATQPIDFSTVSVDSDLGYKSVLVACTYHCG